MISKQAEQLSNNITNGAVEALVLADETNTTNSNIIMTRKSSILVLLALLVQSVVSQQYFPWIIDPRCPEEDRRHLRATNGETEEALSDTGGLKRADQLVLSGANNNTAEHLRSRELSSNSVTFNFKLYWQQGYCWQQEWIERKWCLQCPGKNCREGDFLWINFCDQYDLRQRFEWVDLGLDPASYQNQGLLKVASRNLCVAQTTANVFRLKPCDIYDIDQKLIGFHYSQHFQIGPAHVDHLSDCLTQVS